MRIAELRTALLTGADIDLARRWCEAEHIDCLYLLAERADVKALDLAGMSGFRLTDIRVTFECSLDRAPLLVPSGIRRFRLSDATYLRAIAGQAHANTRFYNDRGFPRHRCQALYESWIERSYNGWADIVLVAECEAGPAGYVTGHLQADCAAIGLLGVAPEFRCRGLGRKLVEAVFVEFSHHRRTNVSVTTQGMNVASQRLYQRCGFVTKAFGFVYHYWPKEVL